MERVDVGEGFFQIFEEATTVRCGCPGLEYAAVRGEGRSGVEQWERQRFGCGYLASGLVLAAKGQGSLPDFFLGGGLAGLVWGRRRQRLRR